MKNIYGEMILKKDSILYHTTDKKNFKFNKKKLLLYCTFHPSDYYDTNKNVVFLRLKKNLSICFMVDEIDNKQIICTLNEMCENKYCKISSKNNNENLIYFSKILKESNFDGWFTSVKNNKTEVEIALLNDNNLFSIEKTEPLAKNWYNYSEIIENKSVIKKNWGKRYSICSDERPVILNINKKMKKYIDNYNYIGNDNNRFQLLTLQYVLKNSEINILDNICNEKIFEFNCPKPWYS